VFEAWSNWARGFFDGLIPLYRDTGFAYTLAGAMGMAAVVLIAIAVLRHLVQSSAITARTISISSFASFRGKPKASENSGVDEREAAFAGRFAEIDALMLKRGFASGPLAFAWRRYRKTLNFAGAPPIRSTQRPNSFFYAVTPPPAWLGFAANLFVAFGLLATFLGLVAALTFASQGMTSDDPAAMQAALRDLLSASASKFVTSVAGVGLSIVLRLVERILIADLRGRIDALSNALEFGIRVDNEANSAALSAQIAQLVEKLNAMAEDELAQSAEPAS